jgi:hypothetical protein
VLVGYALLVLALTLVRINRFADSALAEGVQIVDQTDKMVDPFLLLVIAIGFWLSRKWSYSFVLGASAFLLYRGLTKWEAIALAQFPEVPMFSRRVLTWWWQYGGAEWDFPRLILAAALLVYCAMSLFRDSRSHGVLRENGASSTS